MGAMPGKATDHRTSGALGISQSSVFWKPARSRGETKDSRIGRWGSDRGKCKSSLVKS